MASKHQKVTDVTELLFINDTNTWPSLTVRISPKILDIIMQSAQDVDVSPDVIINIYLARAIVSIDNDET